MLPHMSRGRVPKTLACIARKHGKIPVNNDNEGLRARKMMLILYLLQQG